MYNFTKGTNNTDIDIENTDSACLSHVSIASSSPSNSLINWIRMQLWTESVVSIVSSGTLKFSCRNPGNGQSEKFPDPGIL
ncbi:17773_t:CDS:2, partial [Cetraspora pellucida]